MSAETIHEKLREVTKALSDLQEALEEDAPVLGLSPKKMGRFRISNELLIKEPEVALVIQRDVVIMTASAEEHYVTYIGYSNHFRPISATDQTPYYKVTVITSRGSLPYIEFEEL